MRFSCKMELQFTLLATASPISLISMLMPRSCLIKLFQLRNRCSKRRLDKSELYNKDCQRNFLIMKNMRIVLLILKTSIIKKLIMSFAKFTAKISSLSTAVNTYSTEKWSKIPKQAPKSRQHSKLTTSLKDKTIKMLWKK